MSETTHYVFLMPKLPKNFTGRMNKQAKTIGRLKFLAVAGAAYAIWSEVSRRKLEEQLYQLTIKVNKLERYEGE